MRKSSFQLKTTKLKEKIIIWASQFKHVCIFDSNSYEQYPYSKYELIVGVANTSTWNGNTSVHFEQLKQFSNKSKHRIFGHLSYDLKNKIEPKLNSSNLDLIDFPEMHFFEAEISIEIIDNKLYITSDNPEKTYKSILKANKKNTTTSPLSLKKRITKEEYFRYFNRLKSHIERGDIYEINFCKEVYSEKADIDPIEIFLKLNKKQKSPFSAFYKLENLYALCSSPERFMKKNDDKIISQPIKGTIKRSNNKNKDKYLIAKLLKDIKEQSENNMVVDLVRNDLSKTAKTGTVKVEELRGVYSFPSLHQLISTISSRIDKDKGIETLEAAFPIASMTGMPKFKAMELIEKYELNKRGLFSGCIGYIDPNKDFDFNVVIRTILYNHTRKNISVQAGGAITILSNAESEYEEILLKLKNIMDVLNSVN